MQEIIMIQMGWICPLLIWLVLVCFFCAIFFAIEDGYLYLRKLHQIPCDRCSFHTGETAKVYCLFVKIFWGCLFVMTTLNNLTWAIKIEEMNY